MKEAYEDGEYRVGRRRRKNKDGGKSFWMMKMIDYILKTKNTSK